MALEITYKKLDHKAFEELFREYFSPLCAFARKFVYDTDTAKEIVHDVFLNLWEKKDQLDSEKSIKSYLFTSVNNRCLNYIRDNKKFDHSELSIEMLEKQGDIDSSDKMVEAETEIRIKKALDKLPEKCREVFELSRFEELKYSEIADKLGIAIKTVEAQMSKALKILREELIDYLTIIIICSFFLTFF